MTLEDQITALLAEAEPLRCLPDEEAEEKGLPKLVEQVNALRKLQECVAVALDTAIEMRDEAEAEAIAPRRGPGRPRKVVA